MTDETLPDLCGAWWPGPAPLDEHICRLDEGHPTPHQCDCGAEHDDITEDA